MVGRAREIKSVNLKAVKVTQEDKAIAFSNSSQGSWSGIHIGNYKQHQLTICFTLEVSDSTESYNPCPTPHWPAAVDQRRHWDCQLNPHLLPRPHQVVVLIASLMLNKILAVPKVFSILKSLSIVSDLFTSVLPSSFFLKLLHLKAEPPITESVHQRLVVDPSLGECVGQLEPAGDPVDVLDHVQLPHLLHFGDLQPAVLVLERFVN